MYEPEPHEVVRQSWSDFVLRQFFKISVVFLMAIIFVIIYSLSSNLTNPVIITSNNDTILAILSIILYLLVLFSFTKFVYLDHPVAFNISTLRDWKVAWNVIITVIFITSVYLLLDAALPQNTVYLLTGPISVLNSINEVLNLEIPGLAGLTGYSFYFSARNTIFVTFYVILFFFPLFLFFIILTRNGRKRFANVDIKPDIRQETFLITKTTLFIGIPPLLIFLFFILIDQATIRIVQLIILVIYLTAIPWWLYTCSKVIYNGIRITAYFSYVNLLWIIPLISFFYILPILFWSTLDLLDYFKVWNGEVNSLVNFVLNTVFLHATDLEKIFQAVFIIVICSATIIIGFAEGFSLLAIYRAIKTGWSFTRTGVLASQSPPVIAVITSRILILAGWLALATNGLTQLILALRDYFNIILPDFYFPNFLMIFIEIYNFVKALIPEFLPITLLLVPLFFIISSLFKILSISVITPRLKDIQIFFLLITASFILIVTQILGDIQELAIAEPDITPNSIPLFETQGFLAQTILLFQSVEIIFFYLGFIVALYVMIKGLIEWFKDRKDRKDRTIVIKVGNIDQIHDE